MSTLWEVATFAMAVLALVFCVRLLAGCGTARPAAYESELIDCNQRAQTLCASLDCEQKIRAKYTRPAIVLPASCTDGGVK